MSCTLLSVVRLLGHIVGIIPPPLARREVTFGLINGVSCRMWKERFFTSFPWPDSRYTTILHYLISFWISCVTTVTIYMYISLPFSVQMSILSTDTGDVIMMLGLLFLLASNWYQKCSCWVGVDLPFHKHHTYLDHDVSEPFSHMESQ